MAVHCPPHTTARSLAIGLLLLVAACSLTRAAESAAPETTAPTEQQLKTAFLFNFAKFVDWPAGSDRSTTGTFDLCIGGTEQFAVAREFLAGKTLRGRRVEVRSVQSAADMAGCQLLFVSAKMIQLERTLEQLEGPVLTVGESDTFIPNGGMINIVRADNRLHFEIERGAGARAGLHFSSQLLKLAKLVAAGY